MEATTRKKFLCDFLIFIIIIITLGNLITYSEYQNLFRTNNDVMESYQTIRAANQTIISLSEASIKLSSIVVANDQDSIISIPENIISAQVNFNTLDQLIQDTPAEVAYFKELKPLFDKKVAFLQKVMSTYTSGNKDEALKLVTDKDRFALTKKIFGLIMDIKKIENYQLAIAHEKLNTDIVLANSLFMIFNTLTIFLLIFCFYRINKEGEKKI